MAIHAVKKGELGKPKPQASTTARLPAPYKGIDARSPFAHGAPEVCIYSYNLIPSDGGMALRNGFREWQIGLDNGAGVSVNTIVPYDGLAADGSDDRLSAVTNEGIWDVTTASGTPTLKLSFSDTSDDAGFGVFTTFITDAGAKLLIYADSLNGLFTYDSGTDSWAQTVGITGPTITNINFVAVHKGRIWLVEQDASDSWYLAIGAIAGAATQFYFGSKFTSGGALRGLFSWTVDGGVGVDDLFVGVSGAGDVVIYQGDDPSSATWEIRGVYFIGNLPKGPKFATKHGGELYLLSTYGITAMTDLLNGLAVTSASADNTSARVSGRLRALMSVKSDVNGWSVRSVPSEGGLLVSIPTTSGELPVQYFFNLTVGGWGLWRDLDVCSFNTWKNAVVFGDSTLRVLYMDKEADEVKITPPTPPLPNAVPIQFSMLTSFNPLEEPSILKRVKYIRPDVISTAEPTFAATARYDYALNEADLTLIPNDPKVGLWDTDSWDAAVWGAAGVGGWNSVYGSFGMGRNVAVAYRGQTYNVFTLVGWDLIYDEGGPM
jgi:hypothetical protein